MVTLDLAIFSRRYGMLKCAILLNTIGTYVPIFTFSLAARNEGIFEAAKSNKSIKHKMLNFSLYSLFLVEKITEL